jgi:WhiB family transcriptional regulator, redox-sensing transcriptional regulator
MGNPPVWQTEAACRDIDVTDFFGTVEQQADATRICAGCPVQPDCLDYALTRNMRHGVWGGHTEQQLETLRRRHQRSRRR